MIRGYPRRGIHTRSLECRSDAIVEPIVNQDLSEQPATIVDLLGADEGADVDFDPERLGLTARSAEL